MLRMSRRIWREPPEDGVELVEGDVLDLSVADGPEVVVHSAVDVRFAVVDASLSQDAQDGFCGIELLLLDVEGAGHEKNHMKA